MDRWWIRTSDLSENVDPILIHEMLIFMNLVKMSILTPCLSVQCRSKTTLTAYFLQRFFHIKSLPIIPSIHPFSITAYPHQGRGVLELIPPGIKWEVGYTLDKSITGLTQTTIRHHIHTYGKPKEKKPRRHRENIQTLHRAALTRDQEPAVRPNWNECCGNVHYAIDNSMHHSQCYFIYIIC